MVARPLALPLLLLAAAHGVRVEDDWEDDEAQERLGFSPTDEQVSLAVEEALDFRRVHEKRFVTDVLPIGPESFEEHIKATCGQDGVQARDLGNFADSSRSGASFFNCRTPPPSSRQPRMLVKGNVRGNEYEVLQKIKSGLQEHWHSGRTLMNKIDYGFDAFDQHWVIIEDLKAAPLIWHLRQLGVAPRGGAAPEWSVFDIKPRGNRSPQSPECFHRLRQLAAAMGDPASFTNWPLIAFAFQRDTAFMKGHNLIDESLLIQIAGPFDVEINETSYLVAGGFLSGEALKRTFAKLPLCAYQLELTQKRMGIVCVSILDYLLTFSFTKSIQNYIQGDRWTHYEEKLLELLQCVGNLNQPNCDEFLKFADEGWLEAVQRQLAKKSTTDYVERLEEEYRCCCDTGGHPLKPQTRCEWQAYKTLSFGGWCKDGLYHWPARGGGCWALIAARLGLKD